MFISNEAKGIFQNLYTVRMYNFVCELSMSEVKASVAESFNELSIARMKRKLLDFFRELPIPRMIAYLWLCLTNYIAIFMIFAIWINGYGYDPLYKLLVASRSRRLLFLLSFSFFFLLSSGDVFFNFKYFMIY